MNDRTIRSETGATRGPLPAALLVLCPNCHQGEGSWCLDPTGPGGFAIALCVERMTAAAVAFR